MIIFSNDIDSSDVTKLLALGHTVIKVHPANVATILEAKDQPPQSTELAGLLTALADAARRG